MKLSAILSSKTLVAITVTGIANIALAQDEGGNTMSQGEYLARAGNCVACHTVPNGKPFAGGLKMAVPLLGTIYATNITPDPETGIGNYTFEDFDNAVRLGYAKDGHNLYPAMPYPSYAKINEDDMQALYNYFMKEVTPVKQTQPDNDIPGWKSPRWPLSIWNLFMRDDDAYEPDEDQSEQWNRGAYLVQGLGHCGACHTPRGWFLQEEGLDESDDEYLAGAPLDNWSAASLNGDINSGLGRWSEADIAEYLKTGKNKFGTAFGTMVEVINSSTVFMSDDDLAAIAVYLKSLPANYEEDDKEWSYDATAASQLTKLNFQATGSQIYYEYCVSCHGYDGAGNDKHMPSLAGNPVILDSSPASLVNLTLNGSLRVVANGVPETFDMPYFRGLLNDQQIADVVTFMRTAWGHSASAVTEEQVAEIRDATQHVENDDVVVLRMK